MVSIIRWSNVETRPEKSGKYFILTEFGADTVYYSKLHDAWNSFDNLKCPTDEVKKEWDEYVKRWGTAELYSEVEQNVDL